MKIYLKICYGNKDIINLLRNDMNGIKISSVTVVGVSTLFRLRIFTTGFLRLEYLITLV